MADCSSPGVPQWASLMALMGRDMNQVRMTSFSLVSCSHIPLHPFNAAQPKEENDENHSQA